MECRCPSKAIKKYTVWSANLGSKREDLEEKLEVLLALGPMTAPRLLRDSLRDKFWTITVDVLKICHRLSPMFCNKMSIFDGVLIVVGLMFNNPFDQFVCWFVGFLIDGLLICWILDATEKARWLGLPKASGIYLYVYIHTYMCIFAY